MPLRRSPARLRNADSARKLRTVCRHRLTPPRRTPRSMSFVQDLLKGNHVGPTGAFGICCAPTRWRDLPATGQRPKDGVPDMTAISDIDVVGINENLRVRYKRNEIYTFAGTILVAVNPYQFLPIYETVGARASPRHVIPCRPMCSATRAR